MNEEVAKVVIKEEIVLQKFDGQPSPENLVEKVYLEDGKIIKHEFFEGGELVDSKEIGGN